MLFPRFKTFLWHATFLSAAAAFFLASANAQFAPSPSPSSSMAASATESSSVAGPMIGDDALPNLSASPAKPGEGSSGGQYDNRVAGRRGVYSHLAFEIGGGANAPTEDSSPYITWGGNFTAGAGYRFNPMLTLMAEYQFIGDKLPGRLIAETGANGGNAHIWSLTLAPVVDLFPKSSNSIYVTGGGGFYRKVTNFTDPVQTFYCDYFFCYPGITNAVVGHFSSNQGGWNVGAGFTHRLGGSYGDSKMKLFAEARYLDVKTPAVNGITPNGLGVTTVAADTKVIPVTFGLRW